LPGSARRSCYRERCSHAVGLWVLLGPSGHSPLGACALSAPPPAELMLSGTRQIARK
jgi:hypothetical protein